MNDYPLPLLPLPQIKTKSNSPPLKTDWRRPPHPLQTADYALYIQILTWFLDSLSPLASFSVHHMALTGKDLGTDVGYWFGPSVTAGAIKWVPSPSLFLSLFLFLFILGYSIKIHD